MNAARMVTATSSGKIVRLAITVAAKSAKQPNWSRACSGVLFIRGTFRDYIATKKIIVPALNTLLGGAPNVIRRFKST